MKPAAEPVILLEGKQLWLARAAWIAVSAVLAGTVLASWPPFLRQQMAVCETCEITPAYAETLRAYGVSTTQWAVFISVPSAVVYLGWMGMGLVIFLLKSSDRRALLLSGLLMVIGASFGGTIGSIATHLPAWVWVRDVLTIASFPLFIALVFLFPNGTFKPRWLAWLLGVQTLLFLPIPIENLDLPIAYNFVFTLLMVLICILVPVYRYRRVLTYIERQQTKWVVFGIVLAMAGIGTTLTLVAVAPAPCDTRNLYCDMVQNIGYSLAPLMIPIFIGVGILRSRLWDIDIIIRRTLQYTVLTALLALAYFGTVVLLQSLFDLVSGRQSPLVVVLSTLIIAALFTPLRRRVQTFIDHRFFRQKYDAQQVLAQFGRTAQVEMTLEAVTDGLERVIRETVRPAGVAVWLAQNPRRPPD